ncbi:MAG: flagellar FliL protein [Paracoccaceae bacterium]|jgi:flagellar FliL protein
MAEQAADDKKKKGGGIVKIAIFAICGLALVGIGVGVGYFMFGGKEPAAAEQLLGPDGLPVAAPSAAAPTVDPDIELDANGNPIPKKMVKETPVEDTFVTTYYEFAGTFTTNLRGSRKMAQLGIGVSTQYDESVMTNVDTHQLSLRSEVLAAVSEFSEEDVAGKAGRDQLAESIQNSLNTKLMELEGFGGIEHVHFTSFIIQ